MLSPAMSASIDGAFATVSITIGKAGEELLTLPNASANV